jgi:hypothetical protein
MTRLSDLLAKHSACHEAVTWAALDVAVTFADLTKARVSV